MAADEVPLSRLRSLWLALPFVPWLAWRVPWFAPFLSWPWLFLAFYFWPAIALASALGLPLASQYAIAIYSLPYCLAIAGILDLAVRVVAKRRGAWRPIRARTARWVTAAFALAVVALFAARYAQWIDWPPRAAAIDDLPFPLRAYAAQITNSAVYEIPTGPVDSEYAIRIRAQPELLSELVTALDLESLSDDRVSSSFWTAAAAYWWDPPRNGRFYASRGFPWSDRGADGDYFCVLYVAEAREYWVWHKSNF